MPKARAVIIWTALFIAIVGPVAAAAQSPLLAYRQPIYIAAGFAGIVALALLLIQPLLVADALPSIVGPPGHRIHRIVGTLLVIAAIGHIIGLWITSPPDVIDVLLFRSPTPFSLWGAIAMWAVFATAVLALVRKRLRPKLWRRGHGGLAIIIVAATALHALMIEGTMEPVTKWILCALVISVTVFALVKRRVFARAKR